jgi:hypothetical protein
MLTTPAIMVAKRIETRVELIFGLAVVIATRRNKSQRHELKHGVPFPANKGDNQDCGIAFLYKSNRPFQRLGTSKLLSVG